jgi:uncharacterized protein YktA (UPF0223 family)
MKLTDILRQINEEEENGLKDAPKGEYNFAIIPNDMGKALDALSDPENYVVKTKDEEGNEKIETDFTSNFNDEATITRVFGSRNPSDRDKDAMKNWNSLSPVGRRSKIKDIQKRIPEIYKKGIEQKDFIKAYDAWKNEGNEGSEEDFIIANDYKPGSEFAPIKKVSKAGTLTKYFPDKTKDNMRKYGGALSIDTHYDIDGDKIIFPQEKNPFKTQSLLKRRIETIMNNASVDFKPTEISLDAIEKPIPTPTQTPQSAGPSVLTLTLDPDKIKGKKPELNAMVKLLQNTYDKNLDYDKENNVIKITNIKPERRADVRKDFAKFLKQQSPVKESLDFDFERYQMLRRAGIIK